MIITAQHKLQFGATHQPAMEKRLPTYVLKALPNPKKSAAPWLKIPPPPLHPPLKKHAMDCMVSARERAKDCQAIARRMKMMKTTHAVNMKKEF